MNFQSKHDIENGDICLSCSLTGYTMVLVIFGTITRVRKTDLFEKLRNYVQFVITCNLLFGLCCIGEGIGIKKPFVGSE